MVSLMFKSILSIYIQKMMAFTLSDAMTDPGHYLINCLSAFGNLMPQHVLLDVELFQIIILPLKAYYGVHHTTAPPEACFKFYQGMSFTAVKRSGV